MPKNVFGVEFKKRAVRLVNEDGIPRKQVCQDLRISTSALDKWLKLYDGKENCSESITASEKDELNNLRREVRQLKQECEFLKKTANYFAKTNV